MAGPKIAVWLSGDANVVIFPDADDGIMVDDQAVDTKLIGCIESQNSPAPGAADQASSYSATSRFGPKQPWV